MSILLKKSLAAINLTSHLLLLNCWHIAKPGCRLPEEIPFVPTPMEVVDHMLELAEVKKGDVVYDLGSGDGRIVIRAAKNMASVRSASRWTSCCSTKLVKTPKPPASATWSNSAPKTP